MSILVVMTTAAIQRAIKQMSTLGVKIACINNKGYKNTRQHWALYQQMSTLRVLTTDVNTGRSIHLVLYQQMPPVKAVTTKGNTVCYNNICQH